MRYLSIIILCLKSWRRTCTYIKLFILFYRSSNLELSRFKSARYDVEVLIKVEACQLDWVFLERDV